MSTLQPLLNQCSWWKGLIFQLLPLQDALRLSSTCQELRAIQVLKIPFTDTKGYWDGEYDGSSVYWQALSIDESCDIVRIFWQWQDQGWGNQKGTFAIVRGDGQLSGDFGPAGEDVVVFCHPASHMEEQKMCEFVLEKDPQGKLYQYHIWLRAGGGGGHSLEITNLRGFGIRYLDPEVRPVKQCYQDEGHSVVKTPGAPEGFTSYGGMWKVKNDVLRCTVADLHCPHSGPPHLLISNLEPFADGTVSVEILFPSLADESSAAAGIVLRVSSPSTSYSDDFIGYTVFLSINDQNARIARLRRRWEELGIFPTVIPVGQWVLLEASFVGPSLTVKVNGHIVAELQDDVLGIGCFGLRNWAVGSLYRNLKVKNDSYEKAVPFYGSPNPKAPKGFASYGGEWTVDKNILQCTVVDRDTPHLLVSNLKPFTDGTVSVEVFFPSLIDLDSASAGISFRVARPSTSFAEDYIGYSVLLRINSQQVQMGIQRRNWQDIGKFPVNISVEQWILLEVSFFGPELTVKVNGSVVANAQDATLHCGRIGLRNWAIGTHYRNLKVKTSSYDRLISWQGTS